jgi:hypothetical protein
MSDTVATKGDLVSISIWIHLLVKLLIEKKAFTKDEMIAELQSTIENTPLPDHDITSGLKNMIETIKKL